MFTVSDGIIEDGFSIFLLVAALAFLWFRKPGKHFADNRPYTRAPIGKARRQTRRAA